MYMYAVLWKDITLGTHTLAVLHAQPLDIQH